jgi:hypothetical protein
VLAGLGAYHGLNPGMGWLFAVALGLQDKSRRAVLRALPPIALGHAASVAGVVALVGMTQVILSPSTLRVLSAAVILGFGAFRLLRARHPRWVGMQVGPRDLALWSFIMSSAHGAGLMLVPVLLWCHPGGTFQAALPGLVSAALITHVPFVPGPGFLAAAVGTHTLGLLLAAGVVALLVYEKAALSVLRRAWVNLDLVWGLALLGAAVATLIF